MSVFGAIQVEQVKVPNSWISPQQGTGFLDRHVTKSPQQSAKWRQGCFPNAHIWDYLEKGFGFKNVFGNEP